ncbi:transposase [Roseomonas chloroacetimidivorans]|uniref:transposase n=1 Tax=Roseomonas chloroacetimidivorans TaxID=1766656 RepID=UPI003C718286
MAQAEGREPVAQAHPGRHIQERRRGHQHASTERRLITASPKFPHSSVEKHGTRRRRSWRKLHLATDADTGRIVASVLTDPDADDGSQVGPLLERSDGPVASFTGDGAFDRDDVYAEVAARHPDADVIVPPRSSAVPSGTAEIDPTRRDRHLQAIAERGRMGWQRTSGYNWRALVEADIARWKRVIGDRLHSGSNGRQVAEVAIAANALNRMLDLGRADYVRIA